MDHFPCQSTFISGRPIDCMKCDGTGACLHFFVLDCGGISSCEGLYIQFTLPPNRLCTKNNLFSISKINCNAEKTCDNLMIEIENYGGNKVVITDLKCIHAITLYLI